MKTKKKNCAFVTVGTTDTGKRIRKRIYYNTKTEYNDAIQDLMRQYNGIKSTELLTLGVYVSKWQKAYVAPLAVTTQAYYNYYVGLLEPIYHLKLISITKADLQTILNDYTKSPCTCKHLRKTIARLFNCALGDGYITTNPAKGLTVPKYKQKERRSFTKEELTAILSTDYTYTQYMAVMLFYVFGLRPEELRALTVNDFDLDAKTLTIDKAVVFDGNQPVLKSTKTDEIRILPIPESLIPRLRHYIGGLSGFYLFPDSKSEYMTKGVFTHFYRKIFKRINTTLGIDDYMRKNSLSLYNFRHTVGTRLYYSQHVSNKFGSKFLGHDEKIFVSIYSHLDTDQEDIQAVYAEMGF